VNARDAMPDGGTLTLRAENIILDDTAASEYDGGRSGPFLLLSVDDTGTGIPAEILTRIWEPFFTTKGSGKGTGLGLSTVRGLVESHSGFVAVRTRIGEGTSFRVFLPALDSNLEKAAANTPTIAIPRGTGELVLVVDDEPSIRNMSATMLSRHGYRVLTAGDGAEAISLFTPRANEIRVVITDVSMPNVDGATLAAVIRKLNPAIKIIAVSGLGVGQGESPAQIFTQTFLAKPFRPEALLGLVHDVLRADPPPTL
jgi:two-component system cell cycle sensor histidine kinase/response regulator CckA